MAKGNKIRCHECLYGADGIYNAPYLCNYASLTGHCRIKVVRRKGADGVWRKVKTVETPEECSYFKPRKEHQRRKLTGDARKPGERRKPADWGKAMALWAAGASDREIAPEIGRSQSQVCQWRRRHGLKTNTPQGGWNRKRYDWDLARRLYDQGDGVKEIAAGIGGSKNAVYDWMDREGLERPSKREKGAEHAGEEHGAQRDPGSAERCSDREHKHTAPGAGV